LGHEIDEKNRFKKIGEAFATTHYVSLTTRKKGEKSIHTNHSPHVRQEIEKENSVVR
jgi:hypothetical protein